MPKLQIRIVENVVPYLRSGGRLVYSTCSVEPEENVQVVTLIGESIPYLRLVSTKSILPTRDGMDGAFVALFSKD
jgi:16S rRNA (cytosine967-C5)-methyltransferase